MRTATVYPQHLRMNDSGDGLDQLHQNRQRYRLSSQERRRRRMLSILSVALALMGILIITLGALLGSSKKQYVTLEPTGSTANEPSTTTTLSTTLPKIHSSDSARVPPVDVTNAVQPTVNRRSTSTTKKGTGSETATIQDGSASKKSDANEDSEGTTTTNQDGSVSEASTEKNDMTQEATTNQGDSASP